MLQPPAYSPDVSTASIRTRRRPSSSHPLEWRRRSASPRREARDRPHTHANNRRWAQVLMEAREGGLDELRQRSLQAL